MPRTSRRGHIAVRPTGSIGTQTLDICREYPEYFEVISISAGSNVELLAQQVIEFRPKVVGLAAVEKEAELREKLEAAGVEAPEIVTGPEGQTAVAVADGADTVVTGVAGCAGLCPRSRRSSSAAPSPSPTRRPSSRAGRSSCRCSRSTARR